MKRTWMGVIMAGAILSSGCSTVMGSALASPGTSAGAGDAMTFQKGPVYATGGEYRNPGSHPQLVGPGDSPLAEWGILEFGVKGLPGADIRRLGLIGYAKSWAEDGLGRNVADISQNPTTIYTHVQFRVFPGGGARRLLLY